MALIYTHTLVLETFYFPISLPTPNTIRHVHFCCFDECEILSHGFYMPLLNHSELNIFRICVAHSHCLCEIPFLAYLFGLFSSCLFRLSFSYCFVEFVQIFSVVTPFWSHLQQIFYPSL